MPNNYLSLSGECVTQKIIEKSRFIATSSHVEDEEEARAFISKISAKYADATHNCFAYIADSLGNFPRFSDDGEPQGTAGMPMLEVLKNNKLYQTAVVVTRYFGGIKLGAGGLVRAYSGAVAENLLSAQKVSYEMCAESVYTVDYPFVDSALKVFADCSATVLNTDYSNSVTFTVTVKNSAEKILNDSLLNRLNGKVGIRKLREYFFPFKI